MPASPEFAAKVYRIVGCIPRGHVTTYGRIARAIGDVRGARMVGWALIMAPPELPCQRVVNRNGELTGGWHFGHPDVMRSLLLAEGVPFAAEYQVDLSQCLWDPSNGILATADEMDDLKAVIGFEQC